MYEARGLGDGWLFGAVACVFGALTWSGCAKDEPKPCTGSTCGTSGSRAGNSGSVAGSGSSGQSANNGSSGNSAGAGQNAATAGRSGGASGAASTQTAGRSGASASGRGGANAVNAGAGGAGTGAAGKTIEQPPPKGTTGCGKADFPAAGMKSIDVMGTPRDYIIALPKNYMPSQPYKLVFAWHGLGGSAMQVAGSGTYGYYGLQNRAMDSTIFVSGQGLDTGNGQAGWPNTGGRDVAFVKVLVDWVRGNYCVDDTRIFSVGMSYGGIMSNTLGCAMGDVFRAIAPMSGSGPRGTCVGQPAAWLSHGNMDDVVAFSQGQASRDHWVTANHCQTTSQPTTPSPCVSYDGCDAGHPVVWCEFAGGHTVPQFASEAIWNFFSQF